MSRPRSEEPTSLPRPARLWFGLLAAPIAWFTHLFVGYAIAPLACTHGQRWPLDVLNVLAAAVAMAGLFVALRSRAEARRAEDAAPQARGRARFMALSGAMLSVVFLMTIALQAAAVYLHDPCIAIEGPRVQVGSLFDVVAFALSPASTAYAHTGEAVVTRAGFWRAWNGDPWVIGGLLVLGAVYVRGVTKAWRRAGRGRGIGRASTLAFAGGMIVATIALVSPLDTLSAGLFSAHMTQHLLLISVVAPLLVLGAPVRAAAFAAPPWLRRDVARWARFPVARLLRAATRSPATVLVLHTSAVWLWHAPAPYEAALVSEPVHALEHLSFVGTSMLVWGLVVRAGRDVGHGEALLVLFGAMVQGSLLGLLITTSSAAWYPAHGASAVAWGLTPLEDQQLAGLIMWIPGGLAHVVGALVVFRSWLVASSRAAAARPLVPKGTQARSSLGIIALIVLSGCTPLREDPPIRQVAGSSPDAGRDALVRYGCGACHVIPGVPRAVGRVAPPLTDFADRGFVAGASANTPENLIRFIVDPSEIRPDTAMPTLGVSEDEARDMAGYLYTLRGRR